MQQIPSSMLAGAIPGTALAQPLPLSTPAIDAAAPAFAAYQSAAQAALAAGVWTKISLQTKEFDVTSAFDAATNYRFQPLVAGYYLITCYLNFTTSSTVGACVYKNGAAHKYLGLVTGTLIGGSCVVYLNGSTDYVEFYGYTNTVVQAPVAAATTTYMQGILIARTA